MNNASIISLSNQLARSRQMDIVANNLANANSTAFKSEQPLFTQYLANLGPGQAQKMAFPQNIGVTRNFDEGPITSTGNPLDLALQGDGFFVVNTANGPRYTRAGTFALNAQGRIVDLQGDTVIDENGSPITIPPTDSHITISTDGTISTEAGQLTRLKLVRFDNPRALAEEGTGLYIADKVQPRPASGVKVIQGSLEGSNVQPIVELSRLIEISRQYQSSQNMIKSEDERQKSAINVLTQNL
jgi:flagellar basal-body rod protein FlgF